MLPSPLFCEINFKKKSKNKKKVNCVPYVLSTLRLYTCTCGPGIERKKIQFTSPFFFQFFFFFSVRVDCHHHLCRADTTLPIQTRAVKEKKNSM